MTEPSPTRPRNVVILDAEIPLVEVSGEFYWREDHDRLLADARERAFCEGFAEGYAGALTTAVPQRLVLRPRRKGHLRWLLALVVASFLLSVLLTLAQVALRV